MTYWVVAPFVLHLVVIVLIKKMISSYTLGSSSQREALAPIRIVRCLNTFQLVLSMVFNNWFTSPINIATIYFHLWMRWISQGVRCFNALHCVSLHRKKKLLLKDTICFYIRQVRNWGSLTWDGAVSTLNSCILLVNKPAPCNQKLYSELSIIKEIKCHLVTIPTSDKDLEKPSTNECTKSGHLKNQIAAIFFASSRFDSDECRM